MAAAIEITNLQKVFDHRTAINNLSLTIGRGEIFGLLGPNGAGKTTLLMMLCTLLKPTSGKAVVNGFDVITQSSSVRQSIGIIFQDPSSDELLSGYENLKLHALLYDVPLRMIDKRIGEVLSIVGLENRKHDKVKTYSGGMRRRMEIARGLLHRPEILFLDEPTLGLDPQTREHIWQYIEALAKETQMTIVLTTHYMEEAEKLCSNIAIIDNGKIIACNTMDQLRASITGDIVSIKGPDIPLEKIRLLPFVKKIRENGNHFEITMEDAGKNLVTLLNTAGAIEYIAVRTPDLNDVFIHYTGSEIRETEGSSLEHIRSLNKIKRNP